MALEDGEDDVLFARAGKIFEAGCGAELDQLVDGFGFEVGKIHAGIE